MFDKAVLSQALFDKVTNNPGFRAVVISTFLPIVYFLLFLKRLFFPFISFLLLLIIVIFPLGFLYTFLYVSVFVFPLCFLFFKKKVIVICKYFYI